MKHTSAHTHRKKKIIIAITALLLITALFSAASGAGASTPYPRLRIFARVLAHIESSFVDTVDANVLIEGAIDGLLKNLDPHSAYYGPEEFRQLIDDINNEAFGGVGLEVNIINYVITVTAPLPDTPAEKAGFRAGDQILKIEGKSTRTMSLEDAVWLMRGKAGTDVSITIKRPGENKTRQYKLTRARIKLESVESRLLAEGFGLVSLKTFQADTAERLRESINKLETEGKLEGLILDLRGNVGGLLAAAVKTADVFIKKGDIVTTRGRKNRIIKQYKASARDTYSDLSLVVLIDRWSASASEIVAGALQDHGRALTVGEQTFGKGSVQTLIELSDGSGLKLTIARYYTPSARSIQARGIVPDILVPSVLEKTTSALWDSQIREKDLERHLKPSSGPKEEAEHTENIKDVQLRVAYDLVRSLVKMHPASPGR